MSNEPELLKRGKAFHELVQRSWEGPMRSGPETRREEHIPLLLTGERQRYGRIDLFIDQQSDFVSVIEIKATNWDRVKHRRKLLGSHRRQVLKYVDKYLAGDILSVCAGIIYPCAPKSTEVREEVEAYMEGNAIQLLWWDDSAI